MSKNNRKLLDIPHHWLTIMFPKEIIWLKIKVSNNWIILMQIELQSLLGIGKTWRKELVLNRRNFLIKRKMEKWSMLKDLKTKKNRRMLIIVGWSGVMKTLKSFLFIYVCMDTTLEKLLEFLKQNHSNRYKAYYGD